MKITEYAIQNKTVSFVLAVLIVFGGIYSYEKLGRLEFPAFTIKTALIMTPYSGATAAEVEEEVTDRLETAVQQLSQIKEVRSISRAGLSIIYVDIKDSFMNKDMPQIWDELRRKISDAQIYLPQGAGPSIVNDDFGDEYGVLFALTGEDYTYAELKDYVDILKRELLLVKDVASVDIWGDQSEAIYLEISQARMLEMGVLKNQVVMALNQQNQVVDGGRIEVGEDYIRVHPTGTFTAVTDLENLLISVDNKGNTVYLKDIATIRRGYEDPPQTIMRQNGMPAIGIGISTVSDGNVVKMGEAVRKRIEELKNYAPVGMELSIIAYQSDTVSESVSDFIINLAEAIVIVILVLCISMGTSSGLLMGAVLLLTILGTFIFMDMMGISLQLISLGALILALGMLVDNAIVVTEGILVFSKKGERRRDAAIQTIKQTAWPLLGATIVAILAFAAIGTSKDTSGEFLGSLFLVMAISLGLSWILAITLTPLFCVTFLPKIHKDDAVDPYHGKFFSLYKKWLDICLKHRWISLGVLTFLLGLSVVGLSFVEESFFPNSRRPQFMIDYFRPEGASIKKTSEDLKQMEAYVAKLPEVTKVSTFVGRGALRFLLTYEPEMPNTSYGQLLVTVKEYHEIDPMISEVRSHLATHFPDAECKVKKFAIGPGKGSKIEAIYSGPDPQILRELSRQAKQVMAAEENAINIKDDWRQRVKVIKPVVDEAKARRMGISRSNISEAVSAHFTGKIVGLYREGTSLIPIIARAPENERNTVDKINDIQVVSPVTGINAPIHQMVKQIETSWEDPIIRRKNRIRTITAQCDPREGNASVLLKRMKQKIEDIPLPTGYEMEWGGEFKESRDAQASLFKSVPTFFIMMVLIVIGLFNAMRPTLIIFMCLPLATIGVASGLLLSGEPFGFMCLLGFLGLSGMLIKNAVVLLDQINIELALGKEPYHAVIDASVSRMRPVIMAAMTTVLGMIPLLTDPFYSGISITIIGGLTFGTVLTLFVVPLLYITLYRIKWLKI